MSGFDLAPNFVVQLLVFQRLDLGFSQHDDVIGDLGIQGFQAGFEVRHVMT